MQLKSGVDTNMGLQLQGEQIEIKEQKPQSRTSARVNEITKLKEIQNKEYIDKKQSQNGENGSKRLTGPSIISTVSNRNSGFQGVEVPKKQDEKSSIDVERKNNSHSDNDKIIGQILNQSGSRIIDKSKLQNKDLEHHGSRAKQSVNLRSKGTRLNSIGGAQDSIQNPLIFNSAQNQDSQYQSHNEVIQNLKKRKSDKIGENQKKELVSFPVKIQNLNTLVQIKKKRPKMKFNEKIVLQAEKERRMYSQQLKSKINAGQKKFEKVLDGLLLMFSCRVKNPNQAIRSKLANEQICEVREEDLMYFPNLTHLDISDNNVKLSQLLNLISLEELDIQYNNINNIQLNVGSFPKLQILKISFNKVPPSHLVELAKIPKLTCLEIASNDLNTLPQKMDYFQSLQELNLSSNNFSSDSILVNPNMLFYSLSTIPFLKALNLSRNKFKAFHSDNLPENNKLAQQKAFPNLQQLNMSFNSIINQNDLSYAAIQIQTLQILVITGNPFSLHGNVENYKELEYILNQKDAQLINEVFQDNNKKPPLPKNLALTYDKNFQKDNKVEQNNFNNFDNKSNLSENENFFLTENIQNDQKESKIKENNFMKEQNFEQGNDDQILKNEEQDIFDEDYGKMKMEVFKERCRNILLNEDKMPQISQRQMQSVEQNQYPDQNYLMNNITAYSTSDVIDIVSAYKSLKLVMTKNVKGMVEGREHINGKNYLKPTIASRQATRNYQNEESVYLSLPDINKNLPLKSQQGQRNLNSRSTRAQTRGTIKTRGIDGQLLIPKPQGSLVNFQGMTLQDYAKGDFWGNNQNRNGTGSNDIFSDFGKTKGPRQSTAPCWRKSKVQRVDEKIEKLKKTYADGTENNNPFLMSESQKILKRISHYFPGKDIPLGQQIPEDNEDFSNQL